MQEICAEGQHAACLHLGPGAYFAHFRCIYAHNFREIVWAGSFPARTIEHKGKLCGFWVYSNWFSVSATRFIHEFFLELLKFHKLPVISLEFSVIYTSFVHISWKLLKITLIHSKIPVNSTSIVQVILKINENYRLCNSFLQWYH